MRYPAKLIAFIFMIILIGLPDTAPAADKIPVFVSIVPQKYFVQQIGKDLVEVQAMVRSDASPATYEPKPRQMAVLSKAKIYFAIGVPFEKVWLPKIAAANSKMAVIHTDHGIRKLAMAAHHHHEDEGEHHEGEAHHGNEHQDAGEHPHEDHDEQGGLDPHIWLAPPLVKIQARSILDALKRIDPAHGSVYEANCHKFLARIDQLDADLKKTFTGRKGLAFMVFHPSWGYFARAYGLEQVPIEIEGKDPKPAQLQALIAHAREEGVRIIFVQPQFSTKSAQVVAREIGGQVVFADPLAEDWMDNLREVADKFKAALK
jgi:zinc transport system substrate-binding protein